MWPRHRIDREQSMPPPARGQEPGARGANRRVSARGRHPARLRVAPAVEVGPRRVAVDPAARDAFARPREVTADVIQHIEQTRLGLLRRLQDALEVAVVKDAPLALERAVDALGDANAEPLHPAREALGPRGLDDEVQVLALDRVVDEAEAIRLAAGAQGVLDGSRQRALAQAGQLLGDLE